MQSGFHRSGWVMVRPDLWMENGVVEVRKGRIASVSRARPHAQVEDHGPGVILPALVNAHTHLSLSALRGRLHPGNGYIDWVKELIEERSRLDENAMADAAVDAALNAKRTGTGVIAEVGPLEPGRRAVETSGLDGVLFHEVLGNCDELPSIPGDRHGLDFSYAGHALHTTSPETLRAAKSAAKKLNVPFSLHLAESEVETEFLAGRHSEWRDLLRSRDIDFSLWDMARERPVQRAERLGLLDERTIAVHLLEVTRDETEVLARTGVTPCLCPRSNLLLHGKLPDLDGFLQAGLRPALGTDSLASSPSLSIFDEMAFVADMYPAVPPRSILQMATINGARALGRDDMGTLEPGRRARLMYVDMCVSSPDEAAHLLVSGRPQRVEWL